MSTLLKIDVVSVTERENTVQDPNYAIWFYLDNYQSLFTVLTSNSTSRQAEFFIKNDKLELEIELFRRRDSKSEDRILIGEAQLPVKFLLASEENFIIVEMLHDKSRIAANLLLKVEKFDNKGKQLLMRSASPSGGSLQSLPQIDETQLQDLAEGNALDIGYSSCASSIIEKEALTRSGSDISLQFLENFTLTGSPIGANKNEIVPTVAAVGATNEMVEGSIVKTSSIDDTIVSEPSKSRRNSSQLGVKGLVSLEVVAAQNLPRERRLLRVHYQNNPFVVISFGKQSFRTKVIRRTLNPVFKEKLFFTVKETEINYHLMFSVYDYDKLSYNSCIGVANIKAKDILENPNRIQKLAINLKLASPNEFNDSCLLIKMCFISYDMLRKNFWEVLARQYDHDENGKLNKVEFSAMLESIGSTLSDSALDRIIGKLKVDTNGEVGVDQIVACLEELTVKSNLVVGDDHIVLIKTCPICYKHLSGHREDIDVITHLGICAAKDSRRVDRFVMGGFLTEEYASRKWFMKLFSFMSFGGYRIGKNNGNILVQDRRTGKLMEEKMPTYIRLGIRWMHQYNVSNRATDSYMLRQIFQSLTIKQGIKFNDPASVKNIPDFILYHKIDIEEILEPLSSFQSFNEFFCRKLKPEVRPLASEDPRICVSPADCRLNVFETIDEATKLWIKGANFTITNLLRDGDLARYFDGGSLVVCRLAPQDYHRFHSPVEGKLNILNHIPGTYFTVNPMAVRQRIDVYTENSRTVCLIDSEQFGKVAFIAIGAMMVGSIIITKVEGEMLKRGDELGYFAFGGSTIVMLFPKNRIKFDNDLLINSREQLETLVQMGNSLGASATYN